ncbi:MAG: hypothetical protein A2X34_04760 [Elusimicrobia bacterium GWC2_51_8]|nr:MAG: hypothetical protein A2X33_05520 [Elusimicrobia bacterium GWA2_51_34]OGR60401.1 MAG: hypothetical protein A2X34_04760 [Elusimicrobia bacterium GWC2_51_8]HAF94837.1 hypothetical protein [Elusimicrobiota bacterium]HCE96965.1 hypothetical protein [Elusimicrobiota bacterium]
MKKILLILVLIFSVNTVNAQESKDWKGWYDNLLKGLKTKIQSRLESKNRVSAVAAVRGAKQGSDPMALYWKGGVSDNAQKKLDVEKKQFADAVQLVMDGNVEEGRLGISKFMKDNPDSVFAQDAKEALAKLPAAEKAEVKPASANAEKTGNPAVDKAAEEKKDGN